LQRKDMDDSFHKANQLLSDLVRSSPIAIIVLDGEGRAVMCNAAFEKLFLYPEQEILGNCVDHLIAGGEQAEEARTLTDRVCQGETIHVVTRRQRRDGTRIDVQLHAIPRRSDTESVGSYGMYVDITARTKAEEELQRYIRELETT